jgi:hypothetical protein
MHLLYTQTKPLSITGLFQLAEVSGIEPETTESKSVVLPITPHPNRI